MRGCDCIAAHTWSQHQKCGWWNDQVRHRSNDSSDINTCITIFNSKCARDTIIALIFSTTKPIVHSLQQLQLYLLVELIFFIVYCGVCTHAGTYCICMHSKRFYSFCAQPSCSLLVLHLTKSLTHSVHIPYSF